MVILFLGLVAVFSVVVASIIGFIAWTGDDLAIGGRITSYEHIQDGRAITIHEEVEVDWPLFGRASYYRRRPGSSWYKKATDKSMGTYDELPKRLSELVSAYYYWEEVNAHRDE